MITERKVEDYVVFIDKDDKLEIFVHLSLRQQAIAELPRVTRMLQLAALAIRNNQVVKCRNESVYDFMQWANVIEVNSLVKTKPKQNTYFYHGC